jgi:anti-sigma regulatory factor (Ser/Thr protein kinase)
MLSGVNAHVHGNKTDNYKNVSINADFNSKRVFFTVEDERKGFNPERIQDPVANIGTIMERDIAERLVKLCHNTVPCRVFSSV